MFSHAWVRSLVLILGLVGLGIGLAVTKNASLRAASAASANQPEPVEAVTAAVAREVEYRGTTSSIGTVLATRSVTLRNELAGRVVSVRLEPGEIVEAGTLLVALDVSVEEAEARALEAQALLAEANLGRADSLRQQGILPASDLDRARAERDIAVAQIARTKAIIARKTIRAPFRARVGMSDVHPGQYLDEGRELTTLQGIAEAAHVDFAVPQRVAAGLREGETVKVVAPGSEAEIAAKIVGIDARVDPATRNATVRAKIAADAAAPGASVRVQVPDGPAARAVAVPATALRKGPGGDYLFVLAKEAEGKARAEQRRVVSGPLQGDEVVILEGLAAGERVAASGSFKLRPDVLVSVVENTEPQRSARTGS
jgi:membrane fusion protein (multidrug efflux system)